MTIADKPRPASEDNELNMKKVAIAVVVAGLTAGGFAETLEEEFLNPPREARPQTWWHWMNGNVSREGITADLEAIAEAGLGGVHLFDAGCEIPPGPVAFNTPAWDEHIRFACAEARRLGLEVIIPNCSGWSSSGGPWNAASNSMKIVTTSETSVKGGTTFRGTLPLPKNTNGFYGDIAVMAIPDVGAERVLTKAGEKLTVDAHDPSNNAFEFALDAPFNATALAVQIQPSGWIGQHRAFVTVETSEDGKSWAKGGEIVLPLAIDSIIITSVQNIPFEKPLTARHWRLSFAPQQIPGSIKTCTIGKLALLNRAVIPGFEGKTFVLRDQKPYPAYPSIGPAVAKDAIVDLSTQVKADGSLEWSAPSGKDWKLLRIGYKSNGKKNHPASRFGCGFEVDKLSRTALDFHFESYVGKLCRSLGDLAGDHGSGLTGTLVDSYEIGCQNWTQGFEREFEKRAGYSIRPFLPVLVGYVVGDAPETEKFLDDFRRVIAALFCENYPGALQAKCRQYGLKFYLEPYGNCPADDLEYGYFCDVPMSEFWCGEKNNRGTGVTRMVASMAHVFGKPVVGAEAFTAAPGPWGGKWQSDLWSMKTQGDLAYCEGVNKLIYHRFAHQPWPKGSRYLPGMTMGQWGMHFDRTNTWWPYVGELIRYQARCQYLLTAGRFVADAAVYLGDQMPCTLTPYDDRLVPEGLNCDAINLRGIRSLKVKDGQLVTPGGIRYRLLALPEAPLKRPEAIAAVEAVRQAGGLVCKRSEMKLHLPPVDFSYSGTTDDVKYIHREYADGTDGYFVAYADRTQPAELKLSFRMTGKVPEFWKPATGEIVRAADWHEENGRTVVTWRADPGDSVFVMFRPKSEADVERVEKVEGAEKVEGTWTLTLPNGKSAKLDKLVSWTELDDPDFKYFSGTATYDLRGLSEGLRARENERVYLNLGEVKNLAEVTVNGKTYPVLWKPPFRLDITSSLTPNTQSLTPKPLSISVKVTNLWPNRLIGDDFKPEDCEWKSARGGIKEIPQWVKAGKPSPSGRTTFTTWKHWTKEDQLLPAGILGPVRLERTSVVSDR